MLRRDNGSAMFMKVSMTIAVSLAGLSANAEPTHDLAPATIQGTVLGEHGESLAGATVYAYSDLRRQIEATSDVKGNFVLPSAPTGVVYIDAYKESDGYPYNLFAFHKAIGEEVHKIEVAPGAHIQNVMIKLGPKAATLHFDITQSDGAPVTGSVGIELTRDDNPGPYHEGAKPNQTMLVPSLVPFHFAITVPGYKVWNSQSITAQAGEKLNVTVHLLRQ